MLSLSIDIISICTSRTVSTSMIPIPRQGTTDFVWLFGRYKLASPYRCSIFSEEGSFFSPFIKSVAKPIKNKAEIPRARIKIRPCLIDPACQITIPVIIKIKDKLNILRSHTVSRESSSSKLRRNKRSGFILLARNRDNAQNRIEVIIPKANECRAGAQ